MEKAEETKNTEDMFKLQKSNDELKSADIKIEEGVEGQTKDAADIKIQDIEGNATDAAPVIDNCDSSKPKNMTKCSTKADKIGDISGETPDKTVHKPGEGSPGQARKAWRCCNRRFNCYERT